MYFEDTSSLYCCILIFWIICGLISGYLYRQRGRSEAAGCLGGFLLGPLGIVLALVTPPDRQALARKEKELESEKLKKGEFKKCPYCAELIRPEATVCRHCGRELASNNPIGKLANNSSAAPNQDAPSPKLCPQCGIPMGIRVANQGEHQGKSFYVCPNYKQCRQAFPVEATKQ